MLPTGYGKSLCYEILPDVIEYLLKKPAFVIVIVPLNVILSQQKEKMGRRATCLNKEHDRELTANSAEQTRWTEGQYQFVFAHPEQIIGNDTVREILLHNYFQEEATTFIVVDEAHCVLEWGQDFGPVFAKLGTLRALLPNAKVLALSATLSLQGQNEVAKKLVMTNYESVSMAPARDNISLIMCKRPTESTVQHDIECVIKPLLIELLVKGQMFPLSIVYFSGSQDWVGRSYELAERMLGDASMEKTGDKIKSIILQNLAEDPANSPLKIVFATIALGMGADLRHVRRVINIGPPKRLENYVQQIGRAGRSGQQSEAILFYNNSDIGRPHERNMQEYICLQTTASQ
ncbi:ATP-dependent DNA helicase RecQ-like [Haliotis rubra]|uniref:ATP-dependent DNA helicase RecQ-like n=1 Tax=Haliotis rubra TaxID=36100 RepID=UPI001EE603A4|nr:ATP-dependent DNA helicase RecQ-like [Haliotis rubra]